MTTGARDYTSFDSKMLEKIKASRVTASALTFDLDAEAKSFVSRPGEEFRVVDRRLQALRKRGLIAWERVGHNVVWRIVDPT